MFSRYEKVVDVYIAFKISKQNSRFGFVRFMNIENVESFEKQLQEVMIGDTKIVINLERYHKLDNGNNNAQPDYNKNTTTKCFTKKPSFEALGKGRSFIDMAAGRGETKETHINVRPNTASCNGKEHRHPSELLEPFEGKWTWKGRDQVFRGSLNHGGTGIKGYRSYESKGEPGLAFLMAVSHIANELGRVMEIGDISFDYCLLNSARVLVLLPSDSDVNRRLYVKESEVEETAFDLGLEVGSPANIREGAGLQHGNLCMEEEELEVHSIPRKGNLDTEGVRNEEHAVNVIIDNYNEKQKSVKSDLNNNQVVGQEGSVGPIPDPDKPMASKEAAQDLKGVDYDKELEDLFTGFQRLSQSPLLKNEKPKKKNKSKKNKLVVGSSSIYESLISSSNNDILNNPVAEFKDNNFIRVLGEWVGIDVNVDFNVIRSSDERAGTIFDHGEASAFNDFISRSGLFDFQLGVRRFTKFDKSGSKMSKLDRFLVSHNFFDHWKDASVQVLERSFSDHCPLFLKEGSLNFDPKPFKVFDHWIGDNDLNEFIKASWASDIPASGYVCSPDVILKNKLRL
ncbi:cytochrome P450 [Tanacetum coccineum]